MTTTKKFNKILVIFATLLAVLLLLLPLAGCAAEDNMYGTYVNEDEKGYFRVYKEDGVNKVQFFNVWFSAPNSTGDGTGDYALMRAVCTFTYSTSKSSNGGYEITVSNPNLYDITAYYFDEATPRIMYYRATMEDGKKVMKPINYVKGTPSFSYEN